MSIAKEAARLTYLMNSSLDRLGIFPQNENDIGIVAVETFTNEGDFLGWLFLDESMYLCDFAKALPILEKMQTPLGVNRRQTANAIISRLRQEQVIP